MGILTPNADERVTSFRFDNGPLSVDLMDGFSTEGLLRGAPAPKSRSTYFKRNRLHWHLRSEPGDLDDWSDAAERAE